MDVKAGYRGRYATEGTDVFDINVLTNPAYSCYNVHIRTHMDVPGKPGLDSNMKGMSRYMPSFLFPDDMFPNVSLKPYATYFKEDPNFRPTDEIRNMTRMSFGQSIMFSTGKFDAYCAWTRYDSPDGRVFYSKPLDTYYFEIARQLGQRYGNRYIYDTIKRMYDMVVIRPTDEERSSPVEQSVLCNIYQTALTFGQDSGWVQNMLLHLYYGMVAEENKINVRLGKSIKLLGIHDILINGMDVATAANQMRGRPWGEIWEQMKDNKIEYKPHARYVMGDPYRPLPGTFDPPEKTLW